MENGTESDPPSGHAGLGEQDLGTGNNNKISWPIEDKQEVSAEFSLRVHCVYGR